MVWADVKSSFTSVTTTTNTHSTMKTRVSLALLMAVFFSREVRSQESTIIYPAADMWLGTAYATTAQNTDFVRIGGWGDRYFGFWRFNFNTVRTDVEIDKVMLYMPPDVNRNKYNQLVSSATFFAMASSWNETTTKVTDDLRGYNCGSFSISPTTGLTLDVTDLTEYWREDSSNNKGFLLFPDQNDNKYYFWPSRESTLANKPRIVVYYKLPSFKIPLQGGKAWRLNTEINDSNYASHSGANYYSVDFGPRYVLNGAVYTESNVKVYAAADGVVAEIGYQPWTSSAQTNGHYVVIDHDGDMDVNTGIQTRYLHLAFDPRTIGPVYVGLEIGMKVKQGRIVGYMGQTGTDAKHLHFGFRYRNSGASTGESGKVLKGVRVEGRLLENYDEGTYYQSTNTP